MTITIKAAAAAMTLAAGALMVSGVARADSYTTDQGTTWYTDRSDSGDFDSDFVKAASPECFRVHSYSTNEFGDRIRISARMCYDEAGGTYVVPGSRHVTRVY